MSADIVIDPNALLLFGDDAVVLRTPAVLVRSEAGATATLLRLDESQLELGDPQHWPKGIVVDGSLRLKIPSGRELPNVSKLGDVTTSRPKSSSETEVDLLEEIRRLRLQLWWTQKVLAQLVAPAVLKEVP